MNRRSLLTAAGTTGLAALTGCSALSSTLGSASCKPAKHSLGDVSIERDDHEYEYTNLTTQTYEVRGTVVYVDDLEGLWINDGTGCGRVSSGKTRKVIDPSAFSPGDCIEATGRLDVFHSEAHELPSISAEELSNNGGSDADVSPVGIEVPDVRFEVEWPDTREPMTLELTEGTVAAGNLVVRHQERDGGKPWPEATHDTWADLTGVAPSEEIPVGSTIEFADGAEMSMLFSHPDSSLTKQVGSTHGEGAGPIRP